MTIEFKEKRPMMLTKEEVEAVAVYRVNRKSSKTTNRAAIVMLILALVGVFLYSRVNMWAGVGFFGVACVVLIWQFYFYMPKKQKAAKEEIVKVWKETNV
jgi:hypothetical protein